MKTKKRLIALAAAAMLFGSMATPAQAARISGRVSCYGKNTVGVIANKRGHSDRMTIKIAERTVYMGFAYHKTYKSKYASAPWSIEAKTLITGGRSSGICFVNR